jgi:hypothetical protein
MFAGRQHRSLSPHLRVAGRAISWVCTCCGRTFYLTPAEIEQTTPNLERMVHDFRRHKCAPRACVLPFRRMWWTRVSPSA